MKFGLALLQKEVESVCMLKKNNPKFFFDRKIEKRERMSRKKFFITRQTHYDTLGISNCANESEIKKAYKSMALKYHPVREFQVYLKDKNQTEQGKTQFLKITEAYSTLSQNDQKKCYDAQVKEQSRKDKAFTDFCDLFFDSRQESDVDSSQSFPEQSPLSKKDQEFITNFQNRIKKNETKKNQCKELQIILCVYKNEIQMQITRNTLGRKILRKY